jgi:hypothetical protein
MKILIALLLSLISINVFGQFRAEKQWSNHIKKRFNILKEKHVDTLMVYYVVYGPWTNIPSHCNSIPSVWVFWTKNKEYFAVHLNCDSLDEEREVRITSSAFDFYKHHLKDFREIDLYLKTHKFFPPIPTDGSREILVVMTARTKYTLGLADDQRSDKFWQDFKWINPTITMMDTINYEIDNINWR